MMTYKEKYTVGTTGSDIKPKGVSMHFTYSFFLFAF